MIEKTVWTTTRQRLEFSKNAFNKEKKKEYDMKDFFKEIKEMIILLNVSECKIVLSLLNLEKIFLDMFFENKEYTLKEKKKYFAKNILEVKNFLENFENIKLFEK